LRIATWNVNSVKARLPALLAWLEAAQPDVVCLQETKCRAADFPRLELSALGYRAEVVGQPSYNGVALLSKRPADDVLEGLPGDAADEQARYVDLIDSLRIDAEAAEKLRQAARRVDDARYAARLAGS
jgi:exodeoxyribonuclease-3